MTQYTVQWLPPQTRPSSPQPLPQPHHPRQQADPIPFLAAGQKHQSHQRLAAHRRHHPSPPQPDPPHTPGEPLVPALPPLPPPLLLPNLHQQRRTGHPPTTALRDSTHRCQRHQPQYRYRVSGTSPLSLAICPFRDTLHRPASCEFLAWYSAPHIHEAGISHYSQAQTSKWAK